MRSFNVFHGFQLLNTFIYTKDVNYNACRNIGDPHFLTYSNLEGLLKAQPSLKLVRLKLLRKIPLFILEIKGNQ
jgi:hypothetical protein